MSDPNDNAKLIRRSSEDELPPSQNPNLGYNHSARDDDQGVCGEWNANQFASPDQTRIIRRDQQLASQAQTPQSSDQTVLVRRSSSSSATSNTSDSPEGPVVGWLVVIDGPGIGKSVTLGMGMNTIGRDSGNRVILDFGDTQISRIKHATVTYDPRGRKFFIQHGDSSNLTYVGELPVLSPVELKSGEIIRLGDTTVLKFIPFCGDDFNWD